MQQRRVHERRFVSILEAGEATLELADVRHAEFIDEVEVGLRVAGHIRVAFRVNDSASATETLERAGAGVLAKARKTPWNSLNARLEGPAGPQLTLFSEMVQELCDMGTIVKQNSSEQL